MLNMLGIALSILFISATLIGCNDTHSNSLQSNTIPAELAGNYKLTKAENLKNHEYIKRIERFWIDNVHGKQIQHMCDNKINENGDSGIFCSNGKTLAVDGTSKDIPEARLNIHYVKIKKIPVDDEKGAIVISTGRTETYLKYKEIAYDLWNNGYSVYIIDHRGQGMSDREKTVQDNLQKGHVEDFGLFVSDFKTFVDDIVTKDSHKNGYVTVNC